MRAQPWQDGWVAIHCKGCDEIHYVSCKHAMDNGHGPWGFNGNYERPTFTPSVNIHWQAVPNNRPERRCHFIVTDGNINYCGDCTHDLKGQTIELPEITQDEI